MPGSAFLSDYMTHALPHPTSTASILWMAALLFTTRLGICTQEMKRHSPRNYMRWWMITAIPRAQQVIFSYSPNPTWFSNQDPLFESKTEKLCRKLSSKYDSDEKEMDRHRITMRCTQEVRERKVLLFNVWSAPSPHPHIIYSS